MVKLQLDKVEVLKKYEEFSNIHKVAKFFGVSTSPIKRVLNENHVELSNRRFFVDETYFDEIDSEEKAYWLGFIYADGYIRERKSGKSLEIKLAVKDKKHLELFREHLKSTHKITEGVNEVRYKGGISKSEICAIAIYSSKIVESIKRQGVQ